MTKDLPPGFGANRSLGGYSSEYADDDGRPAPQTRDALAAAAQAPGQETYLDAVVQLCLSRLLVPLMASGDETMQHDPERQAEMAAVLLEQADGQRAVLAFTGVDALQAWNPKARPVPATLDVVADVATQSSAGTILVDFAGPSPLVIDGEILENLALSRRLVRLAPGSYGWLATQQSLQDEAGPTAARPTPQGQESHG